MSQNPQKPVRKSSITTERWTKTADDRIARIEKQINNLESRLQKITAFVKENTPTPQSTVTYTVKKNS